MTVQSEKNIIAHLAVEGQSVYPYDFLILEENDVRIELDGVGYLGGYSTTGIGEGAGNVTLDDATTPEDDGKTLTIARQTARTQEIDYKAYDAFPAETHEGGLDKLTLLIQEAFAVSDINIHIPLFESNLDVKTELPSAAIRASKFLFFDTLGNVSVVDADLAGPTVQALLVKAGHENRLQVDSTDANFPEISTIVNKPNALVQLDSAGNVPLDHLNLAGQRVLGFYRGDNSCDKVGDNPGECVVPDHRNPSQRFPELVPDPDENNASKFQGGDYYVVTMGDGQLTGNLNLFLEVGDTATTPVEVVANDGIMFVRELTLEGTTYVYEGWYYMPNIVEAGTALSVVYDDAGNVYLGGSAAPDDAPNVQIALDKTDLEFVKRDKYFLTQKHDNRLALAPASNDLNTIIGTGFYLADKSIWGPDSDPVLGTPGLDTFSVIHVALATGVFVQSAVSITDASTHTRRFNGGAWGPWKANMTEQDVIDYVALTAPNGTWEWDGTTLAITIPTP